MNRDENELLEAWYFRLFRVITEVERYPIFVHFHLCQRTEVLLVNQG